MICKDTNSCVASYLWTVETCGCTPETETMCTADSNTCKTTEDQDDTCCNGTDLLCRFENTCKTTSAWDATTCGCTAKTTETVCTLDNTCKVTSSTDSAACCTASTQKLCRTTNLCVEVGTWTAEACNCEDPATETYCAFD